MKKQPPQNQKRKGKENKNKIVLEKSKIITHSNSGQLQIGHNFKNTIY